MPAPRGGHGSRAALQEGCRWKQGGMDVAGLVVTHRASREVAIGEGQHALSHL